MALLCIVLLFSGNACKHKKSTAARNKQKKLQVAAQVPIQNDKTADPARTQVLAQKLGLSDKEIKSNKLYHFVNDWYGVPYKYGGCQKTGVDCSCFTNLLYESVYHRKTGRSADEMYNACEKVLLSEVKEGDLIFFKINSSQVSHVGVYLRKNMFVHSSTSKGVIVNSVEEAYYKKYFHSGGRLKNS